jgi:hypothetical protein
MAVARAKGKLRGKQPKLSAGQQRELMRMAGTGEFTIADLAGCSPSPAPPSTALSSDPRQQARPGNRIGRHLAPQNSLKGSGSPQPERYR